MQLRAVFIDLDGTLLDETHHITDFTKNVLSLSVKSGIHIVINSGRVPAEAGSIFEQIPFPLPFISANGAFFRTYAQELAEDYVLSTLKIENIKYIYSLCQNCDASLFLFTPNRIYVDDKVSKLFPYIAAEPFRVFVARSQWVKILNEHKSDFLKAGVLCRDKQQATFIHQKLLGSGAMEVIYTATNFIEVNSKGVTKGSGMLTYLKKYGIPKKNSMAIGDHENDLPMIEQAGFGVAMGNSIAAVKQKADFITLSNNEDGAALAIYRHFLSPMTIL